MRLNSHARCYGQAPTPPRLEQVPLWCSLKLKAPSLGGESVVLDANHAPASDYLQSFDVRTRNDSFHRKRLSTVFGGERLVPSEPGSHS